MDFTTKNFFNSGRSILLTISGFLNAITCLIFQFFYANAAINILQNNFSTISSKFETSTSTPPSPSAPAATTTVATATTTTTRRRRRRRTKTPSIVSSKSESSISEATLPPPPPPPPPAAAATTTSTTPIMTTTTPSMFSSLFDSTPYSSPWMYSTSGDLIGSESGVFMTSTSEQEEYEQYYRNRKSNNNTVTKEKQLMNLKKEYPSPVSCWRRKLPGLIPWSHSRHNVDGRLIIKEEVREHHEYLEATRENGRLVLKLIVEKI